MGNVAHYAAACARYYAMADVGYSQPDRWTFYDRSDWDGWLVRSPANADCSALVSGCYNIAAHHEWGEPFTAGYFPRTRGPGTSGSTLWSGILPISATRGRVTSRTGAGTRAISCCRREPAVVVAMWR